MYHTLFPNGNAGKFSQNMFCIDTTNSGTIDFREFMLVLHLTTNGTPEEKLTLAFRMYDLDGNGFIDFLEMKR
jgi:Ca2+-binding EF-hand superfamily protein